jgi:selenide,water dikinase
MKSVPIVGDVVRLGAGHAHVGVVRSFGMEPTPGVCQTLITGQAHTPYSGMPPGMIDGHHTADEAHIDTGPLCRFAGARLYRSEDVGLDLADRLVLLQQPPAGALRRAVDRLRLDT